MALLEDPLSKAVENFLHERGESVVESALQTALGRSKHLVLPSSAAQVNDLLAIKNAADRLHDQIVELCSRHSFGILLLLFRKIRHELAVSLFAFKERSVSAGDIGTLVEQASLCGTNAILKYSQRDDALNEFAARYTLQPEEDQLDAALRLAVYALAHRYTMFFANTLARRPMGHEVSLKTLIDSYNSRQQKRSSKRLVDATHGVRVLLIPGFVFNLPILKRTIHIELAGGKSIMIEHRNYLPLTKDFDIAAAPYKYLDTDTFSDLWGLPYGKWKTLWAALNLLLYDSIITLWTPAAALRADLTDAGAAAERADDYADTGLGIAVRDSLIQACLKVAEERLSDQTCTRGDVSTFIDGLSMTGHLDDVHFVEQPFLFYDVGQGRVMWDYLRHGGILQAVARKTMAAQSKNRAANTSGPGFEKYLYDRLKDAKLEMNDVETNARIRRGGQQVWDIDLGFVVHDVLVLIEAKNYQKNVKYHAADGVTVSDRIQSWESWCGKLDAKLHKYLYEVRRKWAKAAIAGAICIVCTEETEFVASAERKYWLDFPECPRVCTIDELIEFLQAGGSQGLPDHPCFRVF